MNGKICAAPKGGGNSRGAVRYILGYSLGSREKDDHTTPMERNAAFDRLQAEGLAREDLGVGTVWYPTEGRHGRPKGIYCNGVSSLITAEQEMDAYASLAQKNGVKEPTLHFVFSWSPEESQKLSWETKMAAVKTALEELGLDHHAYVAAGHSDTDHHHVHVAVSSIDQRTLLSWERNRDRFRLSRACREVEIKHDLENDRGLYMARTREDGSKFTELASTAERKSWRREDLEGRLDQQTRKALSDYRAFEDKESWAEVVEIKIRERANAMRQADLLPTWADAHRIAASYGGRLTLDKDNNIRLEVRERLTDEQRATEKEHLSQKRAADSEYQVIEIDAPTTKKPGVFVTLDTNELGMSGFEDVEQSEKMLTTLIQTSPSYVSRVLTDVDGKGTFDRSDVDGYIASRITDAREAANLGDYVLERDASIVAKTLDSKHPTYARKELEALETQLITRANRMFAQYDTAYDLAAFERAIISFENAKRDDQIKAGDAPTFKLSDEQRALCEAVATRKLSWCNGESGSGKSTSMKVLALYAKETGREIIGVATGQRAAEKLGDEAGIKVYNLAKLIVEEERGKGLIKPGSIVLIDESSMTSYKSLARVFKISEERGCNTAAIGDSAQIKNIEAGSPHEVLRGLGSDAGAYVELRTVRRQRGDLAWMPEVVAKTGAAIRHGDADGVVDFIHQLDAHGNLTACEDRTATIEAAAQWFLEKPDVETIITCNDRETAKHGNQLVLDALGLSGNGERFRLVNGTRELAVGMRLQFQKNNKKIGVINGDLGRIDALVYDDHMNRWKMLVHLDSGKDVTIDPQKYRDIEIGYFLTAYAAQGQSVYRAGAIIDKGTSANTAFVQMTRSTNELMGFFAQANFADASDLAKHLGSGIVEHRDVLLLERTIAKTGGPDSAWAKNIRAALASEKDPLRMRYVAETTARVEALSEKRLTIVRGEGRALSGDDTERGERAAGVGRKTAGIDREIEKIMKTTFTEWAVTNKPQIERDAERIKAVERIREERQHEKTRDKSRGKNDRFTVPAYDDSHENRDRNRERNGATR